MSLSPQLANYREQSKMALVGESPTPSTWLMQQPTGQYVPQSPSTLSSHPNLQIVVVGLGSAQVAGADVLGLLKKSPKVPMILLTVPEESTIEGCDVLAGVRDEFRDLQLPTWEARAGESRYFSRPRVDEEGRQALVLRELEQSFVFDGRSEVAEFIERYRISGLLLEAQSALNAAFGETAVKKLALVENEEGIRELFCLVLVSGDMGAARRALESFDEEWWLARSGQASGKLNFDFELI